MNPDRRKSAWRQRPYAGLHLDDLTQSREGCVAERKLARIDHWKRLFTVRTVMQAFRAEQPAVLDGEVAAGSGTGAAAAAVPGAAAFAARR